MNAVVTSSSPGGGGGGGGGVAWGTITGTLSAQTDLQTSLNAKLGSIPTGNQIWVDAVNGNDGTGVIGRLDKPFKTLDSAASVLVSGYTVMVAPGSYTPLANLCVSGSAYYFFPGCTVTYAPTNIEHSLFDMGIVNASSFYVLGYANFVLSGARDAGFTTLLSNHGTSYPSGSNTHGRFECNEVIDTSTGGCYTVDFETDSNSSYFSFDFRGTFQGNPHILSSTDISIKFGVAIMAFGDLEGSTYIDCLTCNGRVAFLGSVVVANNKNIVCTLSGTLNILGLNDVSAICDIHVSGESFITGYISTGIGGGTPITINTASPVTINGIIDTSGTAGVYPITVNTNNAVILTNGLGFRMASTPANCMVLSGGVSAVTVDNYGVIAGTAPLPSGVTVNGSVMVVNANL